MTAAVVLALVAAAGWGVADFLGGRYSRAAGLLVALVGSQVAALVLLAAIVGVLGAPAPGPGHVLAAVAAGVSELVGVAALYRGTARGRVGVVAPVAAAAPVVPLVVGTALGEVPAPVQVAGLVVVVAGIVLAAAGPRAAGAGVAAAVAHGVVSAVGFGGFLVLMAVASEGGVAWALLVARATAVAVLVAAVAAVRVGRAGVRAGVRVGGEGTTGPAPTAAVPADHVRVMSGPDRAPGAARRAAPGLVLVGVLIVVADGAYAAATGVGPLGVVAVLGALHTVVTVGLAAAVLGERVGRVQAVGVVAALAGAAVVAAW